MIPIPHRYALAAAALAGLYLAGYIHGRTSTRDELTAWQSVATATNVRFRNLEQEASDAMQTIIQNDRAALDSVNARVARLREQARSSGSGVPTVPAVAGSLETCQQWLAGISREVDRVDSAAEDIRRKAGECEQNAVTAQTCQAELRQCEGLR